LLRDLRAVHNADPDAQLWATTHVGALALARLLEDTKT
jgi:hypothetical protein